MKRALWGCLLPGAVVLLALGASGAMFAAGQGEVRKVEPSDTRASVSVVGVERGAVELGLTRVGEVSASQDVEITSVERFDFSLQIAQGMAFVASKRLFACIVFRFIPMPLL